MSVCPTTMCIHTHTNDHVYIKDPVVMSEFGGLQKHEKTHLNCDNNLMVKTEMLDCWSLTEEVEYYQLLISEVK